VPVSGRKSGAAGNNTVPKAITPNMVMKVAMICPKVPMKMENPIIGHMDFISPIKPLMTAKPFRFFMKPPPSCITFQIFLSFIKTYDSTHRYLAIILTCVPSARSSPFFHNRNLICLSITFAKSMRD
jgi:hypothetical protein